MREGPFEKSFFSPQPGGSRPSRPGHSPSPDTPSRPGTPTQLRQDANLTQPLGRPRHIGCIPRGVSHPYSRPLSDRGPFACEFSRNSRVGVHKYAQLPIHREQITDRIGRFEFAKMRIETLNASSVNEQSRQSGSYEHSLTAFCYANDFERADDFARFLFLRSISF